MPTRLCQPHQGCNIPCSVSSCWGTVMTLDYGSRALPELDPMCWCSRLARLAAAGALQVLGTMRTGPMTVSFGWQVAAPRLGVKIKIALTPQEGNCFLGSHEPAPAPLCRPGYLRAGAPTTQPVFMTGSTVNGCNGRGSRRGALGWRSVPRGWMRDSRDQEIHPRSAYESIVNQIFRSATWCLQEHLAQRTGDGAVEVPTTITFLQ